MAEPEVFSNPLILGKILTNFGKNDLLNLRSVSKTFDYECVRLFTKRGYGRWINGIQYIERVQDLVKESYHPNLLVGKIKMKTIGNNCDLDSHPEYVKMVTSNSEHVQSLNFNFYPFPEVIPILNDCSNLVELRIKFCVGEQPNDPELCSKMSFKLKNLSKLELDFNGDEYFSETQESVSDFEILFIKNIIAGASDKLTLLSINATQLAPVLKPILENVELSKKLESLKTLHVNNHPYTVLEDTEEREREMEEENHQELRKLLSIVRNSIQNLHVSGPSWEGLSKQWPEMPNLTTISLSEEIGKVPDIQQIPSKSQAPKLKFLLLGHSEYLKRMWRQETKDCWMRTFQLDKESQCFMEDQGLTVVLLSFNLNTLEALVKLMTDLNGKQLFMDFSNFPFRASAHFTFQCIHGIPSLTHLVTRTESDGDIKVADIRLNNSSI